MNRYLTISFGLILLTAAGCAKYERKPLDLAAYQASWTTRDVASSEVAAFAQRLTQPAPNHARPSFDVADGVSLDEAEIIALYFNPNLRVARLRAQVASAGAEHAGLWDDPVLGVDAQYVLESIAKPWDIASSLGITIPLSGRLAIEKSKANSEYDAQLRRVEQAEWQTRIDLRTLWLEWSAAIVRARLAEELLEQLDALLKVIDGLERVGELPRVEARLFRVQRAARHAERLTLQSLVTRRELAIKALMGLAPKAPLTLVPSMALASPDVNASAHRSQLAERNPALALARAEYEIAEQTLHLEIRRQYPDLQLGPGYEYDEGQNKVGIVGIALPIPLWNRNQRGVAEATAAREVARAAFEAEFERLVNELAQAHHAQDAAAARLSEMEHTLAPLADEQLSDARKLADVGELNTLLLLDSLRSAYETKLNMIDARLDQSRSAVAIQALLGPLPHAFPSNQETHP